MKQSWVSLTQHRFSHKKLSRPTLLLPAIILTIFTTSAEAAYQYTYTGNTFKTLQLDTGAVCNQDPIFGCEEMLYETFVSVNFTFPTLLSGGINLPTNLPYTISTNESNELAYPYIPPFIPEPPNLPGTYGNPNLFLTFNILSVNPYGLPTDWDISIYSNYYNGHDTIDNYIKTSTNQDRTLGSLSRFEFHEGQLDNAPGKWTVSAVPEPSTYVLLLSGLGLITFSARRRNSNYLRQISL